MNNKLKGKKFNAHEKHFKKKEIKFNKEIEYLRKNYAEVNNENITLSKENAQLRKENLDIKTKYEKLLRYSKLTDNEIKAALQSDKSVNQFTTLFDIMSHFI